MVEKKEENRNRKEEKKKENKEAMQIEKESKKEEVKKKKQEELKKDESKEEKERSIYEKEAQSPWEILLFPHTSEKSIRLIEKENTLVFIVRRNANKPEIKKAVEKAFNVKVDKVRTLITRKNEKKAYVKLNKNYSATDIAIRLGII